jgi:ankyrin repeat protein
LKIRRIFQENKKIDDGKIADAFSNEHKKLEVISMQKAEAMIHIRITLLSEMPLHLAVKYGYIGVVKYLVINNKADIEAKNNKGKTPLAYCL